MGEIVAGFGVPHTPMFPALVAREGPQCETAQLFRAVGEHLEAIQPDALVVFDSDHLNTFFLDNYPNLAVGVADRTSGPNDGTPALPPYTVPVSEEVAARLYAFGLESGFDLALTQEFDVDHSILVPLHFLTPRMQLPIVPVFINGVVHPLPAARRCFALGQMVRRAVATLPAACRVAVLAAAASRWTSAATSPRPASSPAPRTWAGPTPSSVTCGTAAPTIC